MITLSKIKDLLLYANVGKENYKKVWPTIAESNRNNLLIFSGVATALVATMFLLSFCFPLLKSSKSVYAVCTAISILIYLVAKGPAKNNIVLTLVTMYVFSATLLSVGIALGTIIEPNQASASFGILMFAVPLLFTDNPLRVNLMTIISIVIYIIAAHLTQEKEMLRFNMSVVIPYGVVSLLIITFLMKTKINSFVLQDKADMMDKIKSLNATLQDQNNVITNAGMGIWSIRLQNGKEPELTANDAMKTILGIDGKELTPEQTYKFWFSNIESSSVEPINATIDNMIKNGKEENTYKWIHPELGERFVRSGGFSTPIPGGYLLRGYHYDVTNQVEKDNRLNYIITSLAYSYDYLAYISIKDDTFSFFESKLPYEKEFFDALDKKNASVVIKYYCEKRIHPDYKQNMVEFTNLSTLNQRLKDCQVVVNQYMNSQGIWFMWSYIVSDRNQDGSLKHVLIGIRKIDEEKQAELRKQKIIDDNIAANKAKTRFLQNMSHEIRTPLNAMFGFAQLLGLPDGTWTEEEKEEYNQHIYNSYNMLEMLIGDILDIADSEHGNYQIHIGDTDINSTCRGALMTVEYRRPAAVNLYYTSNLPDGYTIQSDSRRIQQVLINYLTNACKHTISGEIHLHCEQNKQEGLLSFSVTDTGTGVPPEKADLIFKRFTKLDQFSQGSGLGLNICQVIADKLGGKVYLDKSYTEGARFVFEIADK